MKRWLHPYAIFVALTTLLAVLSGAWVTSAGVASAGGIIEKLHLGIVTAAAALIGTLSICLLAVGWRQLGWILLAATIIESWLGEASAPISHAVLAHVLFAITVMAALCTSRSWESAPDHVFDQGWPSLRSMGTITPVFVLAQVMLGAAFRHKAMGLTWHIIGAMVVTLMVLILGMCVMQAYPTHRVLRPFAISLLSLVLAQVLLGIAAVTVEMMAPDNAVPSSVISSTMAHVSVGAITLAASLALAAQIRRNVQKPVEEPEKEGETAASA